MKKGANVTDQAAIKKLIAAKKTVNQISSILGIEKDCIQSFVDHFAKAKETAKKGK